MCQPCSHLVLPAFLNEAGFNFVRKCIELVEMRGESFVTGLTSDLTELRILLFVSVASSKNIFNHYAGINTMGLYRIGGVNSKVQKLMTTVFCK